MQDSARYGPSNRAQSTRSTPELRGGRLPVTVIYRDIAGEVKMDVTSLWESIANTVPTSRAALFAPKRRLDLNTLASGSMLAGQLDALRGRRVLLATKDQFYAAVALLELDGIAQCIVLATPDLDADRFVEVARTAAIDAVVSERGRSGTLPPDVDWCLMTPDPSAGFIDRHKSTATEWILLTSGTTGHPKLVVHTLESLGGTLPHQSPPAAVWSTFYDIRRYGGLQIYLRAVLSGAPLVLSSPEESTVEFLARAGAAGVTHISGTPSHWRRALMSGQTGHINPAYVRVSGEVADQTLLDQLHAAYPNAKIAHAFASTEAGVAFDVDDGRAGFPAAFIGQAGADISMKVVDGTLRIRSQRTAAGYLGGASVTLAEVDGYVDTGDLVELSSGRYYFRGRKGGIINVGGLKVYPEEVEAVLNADPRVRMSLVRGRRNPITGAIVVADIVLSDPLGMRGEAAAEKLRTDLLDLCRRTLPAHKVPALLRFVPSLDVTAAGKMVRPDA